MADALDQKPRYPRGPFHCPRCHVPMTFVRAFGEEPRVKQVYSCPTHGEWVLLPDIYFRWMRNDR